MPKLYEYLGSLICFCSNEHEPIHVHGKRPLEGQKLKDCETLVKAKAEEIVERWIGFFVHHVRSKPEIITRRIK
jgi:hypothetical protein